MLFVFVCQEEALMALKKNPDFDEANFNLGAALFRSTIADTDEFETAVVPSRVIRYIKALKLLER